ncbi:MAG: hypothetical protein A2898_03150 [Candidatus Kerfeldbacteria bacterium RIFCSPLOWO2_01_FULL_48_11]|uniref:O-antigen ligase-related domain-containing protein n=1 Tax=Candidatus Kerfeldbacteria bacterium RIFCSPLOWO2_01_FULL_48_11 TaxID=1798543 RepID=A0A1G2B9F1_9BACT|nr:MAG: hypothetical protein A2898_03150 [Candidatus Kerfeldbacteria bacterium RIFCSPLOWO2_01_FULL_48_11]
MMSEVSPLTNQRYIRFIIIICGIVAGAGIGVVSVMFSPLIALALVISILIIIAIWRYPMLGIILIAFSLPFERIGAYEFQGFTIRASQLLLLITSLICFVQALGSRRANRQSHQMLVQLGAFVAVTTISLLNAQNMERSVTILGFTVFTMLLTWLVPSLIRTERQVRTIILVVLISAFIVSGFGIFQFLGDMVGLPPSVTGLRELYTKDVLGFPRVQSTAYEPLYFANYLLIPLSLALTLFLASSQVMKHASLILLLLTGGVSFILTVSRGAYLGLACAVAIVAIYYLRRVFTLRNIIIISITAVVIWFAVVEVLGYGGEVFNLEKYEEHVTGVFLGASYDERVYTFEQAFTVWRGHPFFGTGVGGFGPVIATHPYVVPDDGWKIVNNEFIELLAETGIIGLALFIAFAIALIVRSFHAIRLSNDGTLRALMVGLLAAWIGILAQYLTFSTLYIMHIWFLVGLIIATQNIIFSKSRSADTI